MKTATRERAASKNGHGEKRSVETRNDLPQEARQQMVELLNRQLADTFDLFSQTKQAHWNVKGPDFYQLHELYDELAGKLLAHADEIAERATALGGVATGTVRMAAGATRLEEFSGGPVGSMESVRLLVERYADVAESTRKGIKEAEEAEDQDTQDLLTEISRDLDKSLWFLEAHLQGQ